MQLNSDILKYINKSVLCWLATASKDGLPNVSPKEIFTTYGDNIIIANIASPQTVKNIQSNPNVCISFIDILVQKGYQLKGQAQIIPKTNPSFEQLAQPLLEMTGGNFPFASITKIEIESQKPILAPKYLLYPETTEVEQIASAKEAYNLN